MSGTIPVDQFKSGLFMLFDEVFDEVYGIFLDRGTSLFETLATISAEDASRPVSASCASIAAQVNHVTYYLDVLDVYARGEQPTGVDWQGSWQVGPVDDAGWAALKERLRTSQQKVRATIESRDAFDDADAVGGAMTFVVHTAYHLGEIRQALCTVRGAAS